MSINQQSFFLRSGGEYLACTALIPEYAKGAVIMLSPFAEERKGTLPLFLQIGRKLHAENIATLIFDWHGSGDSSGDFESATPEQFRNDFKAALTWLRTTLPDMPVTAIGVRLSATLLTQIAADIPYLENIVLISPTTGFEFIRQLLQRRMVNDMVAYGKAIESRASLLERLKKGESIDLDGYIFSASFHSWIEGISISNIQHPPTPKLRRTSPTSSYAKTTADKSNVPQTLLIPGGHSKKTVMEISEHLSDAETAEIRFPPFWNTVGHVDLNELIECIAKWVNAKQATPSIYAKGCNLTMPESVPGMQLINIAKSCDSEKNIIRAAINTPISTPQAGVLFLPGWSGDRTGPHRLFMQLARKLNNSGYLCMRPDFQGRGLSDGCHADASIASMAEDAAEALADLKERLPADMPIYVAAICSGCKVAITLAAKHPEINKLLLLSAESMGSLRSSKTDSNKTKRALHTYIKKLTQLETWKKILTGKIQTKMVTKALVKHETRSDDESETEDYTLAKFKSFSNPVHFVFGGSDPDASGSMAAYKAYCEDHSIPHSIHLIPHAGHSYYSAKWSNEVLKTSIHFLYN
ncbi:MAG: alpha/beta hydrolase [Kiritimatiellae bacterium]|jgi:alpha/beta superfamily hydrolase|nr:alpha/beta hydrolase [Kiritimatiellia bacterium]